MEQANVALIHWDSLSFENGSWEDKMIKHSQRQWKNKKILCMIMGMMIMKTLDMGSPFSNFI
jgi:hypothetical protein